MEKMVMTVPEMAVRMGISRPLAYQLARQDSFPVIRVGKRLIIPIKAFELLLSESAENRAIVCID
mgnify:CR=1 FL=1